MDSIGQFLLHPYHFFLRFIGGADSDTEVSIGQTDGNYSLYLH